jgi:hypothetical protein
MRSIEVGFADEYTRTGRTSQCLSVTVRVTWKDGTYFYHGAQREPGLMRHACLASIVARGSLEEPKGSLGELASA